MKAQIHPTWYEDAKVTCSCGATYTIGASVPEFKVEICSECHPFYTGTMKLIDTAGRVDAFRTKMAGASKNAVSKTEKRRLKHEKKLQEELERPESLSELRSQK